MKKGLGKGLGALFDDNSIDLPAEETPVGVRLSDIEPNRGQPRSTFDEEKLRQLADSIAAYGVLQPIIVTPTGAGNYRIIAGERRWRAARLAGLSEIPVIIRELSQQESMEIALIENMQRENLNPIEEAQGLQKLMDEFNYTQEKLSERIGRSRPAVANSLRLLGLSEGVQEKVRGGELSAGHARTLLGLSDEAAQLQAAQTVVEKGLSVRETESLVKRYGTEKPPAAEPTAAEQMAALSLRELERELTERFGRRVRIAHNAKKGTIKLEYYGTEDLEALLDLLRK